MSKPIRISASRLKTLWDCSLKFWYQEVQGLPDSVHWKTKVGTVVHLVFECLMRRDRPARSPIFRAIMIDGTIHLNAYRPLARFVAWQLRRVQIDDKVTPGEIEELLRVAFLGIRPYFTTIDPVTQQVSYSPPPDYRSEQRFQMTLPSGAVISGFIDLLLLWPGRAVCIDIKTQAKKFPREELPSNVQSAIYQLATFREHGLIPTIDFVLVRHAPTTRTIDKHIQRVEPLSEITLNGLIQYIDAMYVGVNKMTLDEAMSSPHSDHGFCERVCSHYAPHPYWLVVATDDPDAKKPISSHILLDDAQKAAHDGGYSVVERQHLGCSARWRG